MPKLYTPGPDDGNPLTKILTSAHHKHRWAMRRAAQMKEGEVDGYTVYIDDNFNLYDETFRVVDRTYGTYEEAIARCREIIDTFIAEHGSSPEALAEAHASYGVSPFAVPVPKDAEHFSASRYYTEAVQRHFAPKL